MKIKLISSLEKCFLDEDISLKPELRFGSMLKNEIYRFGAAIISDRPDTTECFYLSVRSPLREYITVKRVEAVPVQMASDPKRSDDDYLRKSAGLYPDILQPLEKNGRITVPYALKSLMIEIDPKSKVASGIYPVTLVFTENTREAKRQTATFNIEIIDAALPKQELIYTQWFYCDCLKEYYGTETFDERHWQIIQKFMEKAVRYGVNMLLTPVFTPPLDTAVGGERPTIQLVGIEKNKGKYSFDFTLLLRWVELCNKVGIKYLEISHLFTQWGAKAAPKIMATVDGEYRRIFGWETDAASDEYKEFLGEFIPALLTFMRSIGADKRCFFHISDEPNISNIESYKAAKDIVAPLLVGYPIIDALSDYEFYCNGVTPKPIPASDRIEPFLENGVEGLWTYYCGWQGINVSNRFIAMPSYRNRIMGIQMYKFGIEGFLHWGYNYYFNRYSYASINPFLVTDGEHFVPAGDTFSVYPGPDGEPLESVRMAVFLDALQDMRALTLCERLYGRDYVISLIDEQGEITFSEYPRTQSYIIELREKINKAIKERI